MADLRSFLRELDESNELIRIRDPISVRFEAAAVLKKFDRGPAVLFEKIKEGATPLVANICGTRERICRALNIRAEELHARIVEAMLHPVRPKLVEDGPVKEVLGKPKLTRLPILTHYEKDAGPYITSAIVAATSPDGKTENVSIHRLLVLDDTHLAIRLVPRHLHHLHEIAKSRGKPLDVAIAIGLHPAISLAATSPVPMGVSEYDVANSFMRGGLRLTRCEYVNALAPADAELVLEGQISPTREVLEGPMPDILGTYDITRKQPVIDLVGVMHREDFIYQALLPASREHQMLMGLPREAKIWDAVRHVVPVVGGVNLTPGGCGWFHAIISIKKQSEGDGKNALMAAFAAHPSLKHAIVVDLDIDVFNMEDVEWAVATRFQGDEDLLIVKNVRGSSLDPASDQERELTTKVGIDATRPLHKPAEKFERAEIPENRHVEEALEKIERKLGS